MHPAYLRYSNDDDQFCAIIPFTCDAFPCRNNAIGTFCSINALYVTKDACRLNMTFRCTKQSISEKENIKRRIESKETACHIK